ncbi:MAG: MFS transporter [Iodobacter sp.]
MKSATLTAEPSAISLPLLSLSLTMLLSSLGTSIANVSLPTLAIAFAASFQQVQWVVIAYLLAITTLIVSAGRLGDMLGRRRLLLAGLALFTLASLLCGIATTLWQLIAARALQGLGAALMMALSVALTSETMTNPGRAMGLLGTMSALGTALGPSLGGLLIAGMGWRAIFLLNLPLGILTILLAHRFLPPDRPAEKQSQFDLPGSLLLALTLAAYALAMTSGQGFGLLNGALILAALAGAGLFIGVEQRSASPLLPWNLFTPKLRSGLSMSALVSTVMMATLVVGPFYLARSFGLDALHVGLVMSAGPVAAALAGLPAGHMVDRFGAQRMCLLGLGGIAAGCLVLSQLPQAWGLPGYMAPIVLITISYALFMVANNTAVMSGIGPDQRGVMAGMLSLSRNLGLISGASVMGALFAFASTGDLYPATAGMRFTFAVATALIIAALVIAIRTEHSCALNPPG